MVMLKSFTYNLEIYNMFLTFTMTIALRRLLVVMFKSLFLQLSHVIFSAQAGYIGDIFSNLALVQMALHSGLKCALCQRNLISFYPLPWIGVKSHEQSYSKVPFSADSSTKTFR